MTELIGIVSKDLKDSGADSKTLELWKVISKLYEEGGPEFVERAVIKKVKEIRNIAKKQLKETKKVIPKKKKKRKRARR